jgi:NAD-dependent SIR2 family protein deacetylase
MGDPVTAPLEFEPVARAIHDGQTMNSDDHASSAQSGVAHALAQLQQIFAVGPIVVLSGAGLSTASGIPGYRDDDGRWMGAKPMDHRDFIRDERARKRYWARSFVGWKTMGAAHPTIGHRALARLEAAGRVAAIITQNVDGLHQKAGSHAVLELHGAIGRVVCLSCRATLERSLVQQWLHELNPAFDPESARLAPDGDAHVDASVYEDFSVAACPHCAGVLKPDVVFFGDSVPRARVEATLSAIDAAAGLLVVGSSLTVYSGYRFARHAFDTGKCVIAVNRGKTRADALFAAKAADSCDAFLARLEALESLSP